MAGRHLLGVMTVLIFACMGHLLSLITPETPDRSRSASQGHVDGIVSNEAGQPIVGATVHILWLNGSATVTTTSHGRFRFGPPPSSRATLYAEAAGHVTAYYGQSSTNGPVGWLVTRSRSTHHVSLTLKKGQAISGILRNELGSPLVNSVVTAVPVGQDVHRARELLSVQNAAGIVRLLENRHVRTSDRGEFRIGGLAPGNYYIVAAVGPTARPLYYPSTWNSERAKAIHLRTGSDCTADLAIVPARDLTLAGTVIAANGQPASNGVIRATRMAADGRPVESTTFVSPIQRDGRFQLAAPEGQYLLVATVGRPWLAVGEQAALEAGRRIVRLSEGVTDLILQTALGATISGRVVTRFETTRRRLSSMRIRAVPIRGGLGVVGSAPIHADGTFRLKNVFAHSVLNVSTSTPELWVKAISVDGRDVTDVGVAGKSGGRVPDVMIELGNPAGRLEGTVFRENDKPAAQVVVISFPLMRSLWPDPLLRYTRVTRTASDGQYTIMGIPPGRYLMAAIADFDIRRTTDPKILEAVAAIGTPIDFTAESLQVVNLRLRRVALGSEGDR